MTYGLVGTMRAKPGEGARIVPQLVDGAAALREHGCRSYVVGTAVGDADLIVVSEVWDSREAHAASLQLPEVRASIEAVLPLLTGEFTQQEHDVAGGLGA